MLDRSRNTGDIIKDFEAMQLCTFLLINEAKSYCLREATDGLVGAVFQGVTVRAVD